MIATVGMGAAQYHHTINTLKYADRAKEIKTHVRRNQGSVAMHVAQMRAAILQLQQQNAILKAMLTAPVVRSLTAVMFQVLWDGDTCVLQSVGMTPCICALADVITWSCDFRTERQCALPSVPSMPHN